MPRKQQTEMTGPFWKAVSSLEKRLIQAAITRSGGFKGEAATRLGVSLPFLRARIRRYGLED